MTGMQGQATAKYEAGMARQNAQLSVEQARDSIDRGKGERRQFWRDVGRVKGEQNAAMAANGIDLSQGTALLVQQDTQSLAEEDAANLYKNIDERTRGYQINAMNFVSEAKAANSRGKAAMAQGVMGAATSVMSGFQQHGAMRAKLGKPPVFGKNVASKRMN